MSDPERLYTVTETADKLGWYFRSVYRAIYAGRLRAVRIGRGRGVLRVPESAIAEFQQPRPINADAEYSWPPKKKQTSKRRKAK